MLQSTVRLVEARAHEGEVRLVNAADPCRVRIRCDETSLKQVLINLMANSVKFTPPGGRVTVSVASDDDGGLTVKVSDTGIGIPEDQIEKILVPFVQVESAFARKHAGTGLGLPLAKALVELHDGILTIESELGIGTTVSIWLPPERVLSDEKTAAEDSSTAAA